MQRVLRKKHANVSKRWRKFFYATCFLGLALVGPLYSQSLDASWQLPTEPVEIGRAGKPFGIHAVNKSTGTYSGFQFKLELFNAGQSIPGSTLMHVKPGSVKAYINSLLVPTTSVIHNSNVIQVNATLNVGDTLKLLYTGEVGCDLYSAIQSSGMVSLKNKLNIIYAGNQSKEVYSDVINVKYPNLAVRVPGSPQNRLGVDWNQEYVREVPVDNISGASSVDTLTFAVRYQEANVLSLISMEAVNALNGQSILLNLPTPINNRYVFVLNATQFSLLGMGNSFGGGSKIIFKEKIKVKSLKNTQTDYTARWGKNGQVCNDNQTVANGSLYVYPLNLPNPSASVSIQNLVKTNVCDRDGSFDLVYKNTGTGSINTTLQNRFIIYLQGGAQVKSITLGAFSVAFTQNSNTASITPFNYNPDGTGGLSDINGDNVFDDLEPGAQVLFKVNYTYPQANQVTGGQIYLYPFLTYLSTNNTSLYSNNYISDNYTRPSVSASGPSDLVVIDSLKYAQEFTFSVNAASLVGSILKSCTTSLLKLSITLPDNFIYDSVRGVTFGSNVFYPTRVGNLLSITVPNTTASGKLFLGYKCGKPEGFYGVRWDLNYLCGSCADGMPGGTFNVNTFAHSGSCPEVPCEGPNCVPCDSCCNFGYGGLAFQLKRQTLGYKINGHTGLWYENQLGSKVTEDDNIDLNMAMAGDTIAAILNSSIAAGNTCGLDTIYAKVFYNDNANTIAITKAVMIMNGSTYNILPYLTSSTSGASIVNEFFIPASLVGGSATAGEFAIKVYYKVSASASRIMLDYFRGQLGFYLSDGTMRNTDHWGSRMDIYQVGTINYGYSGYSLAGCSLTDIVRFQNTNIANFPNEFRPAHKITAPVVITLPEGMAYMSNTVALKIANIAVPGVSGTYDVATRKLSVQVNGGWPLLSIGEYIDITYSMTAPQANLNKSEPVALKYNTNIALDPSQQTQREVNSSKSYNYYAPSISMISETNQPGYERAVTWRVYIENKGTAASYSWLAMYNSDKNTANINVLSVNGNTAISRLGKYSFIKLGALAPGEKRVLDIRANYTNCSMDKVDTLHLLSGWSCTDVTSVPTNAVRIHSRSYLTLTNKTADMQAVAFASGSKKSYLACETIPYTVNINSTSVANMYSLGFWLESNKNVELVDDLVETQYDSRYEVLDPTQMFSQNIAISSKYYLDNDLLDGFPGGGDTMRVNFGVKIKCEKDSITNSYPELRGAVRFFAQGETNCGETKLYEFSYTPSLVGFEAVDSILLTASSTGFARRYDTAMIEGVISNISALFVDSVYVEGYVPTGMLYLKGSTQGFDVEPTVVNEPGGLTKLLWALPPSIHMPSKETLNFRFALVDSMACPNDNAQVVISSYLLRNMKGCTSGCFMRGTTDSDTLLIPMVKGIVMPSIQGLSEVCTGDEQVKYAVARAAGVSSVEWSVTPANAAVLSPADTSVSVNISKTFSGTITLRAIGRSAVCDAGDTVAIDITVHALPTVTFDTATTAGLSGNQVELRGGMPLGGVYSGPGVMNSPYFDPLVAGPGAHIITYTYTTNKGCKASDSTKVTVNCDPVFTVQNVSECSGDTVSVSVNTSDILGSCAYLSYNFRLAYDHQLLQFIGIDTTGTLSSGTFILGKVLKTDTLRVQAMKTGGKRFVGSGNLIKLKFRLLTNGSSSLDLVDLTFNNVKQLNLVDGSARGNSLPSISLNDAEVCAGESYTFTPVPALFAQYKWSTGSTSPTINVNNAGTYWVSVTDTNGCSSMDSAVLSKVQLPAISIQSTEVCANDTSIVSVNTASIPASCNLRTFRFELNYDPTKVRFAGFDSLGTMTAHGYRIIVTPLGTNKVRAIVMPANAQKLSGSGALLKFFFIGLQEGTSDLFLTNFNFNATANTNLTPGSIIINGLPNANAGTDVSICSGDTTNLTATGGNGYQWSNGVNSSVNKVAPLENTWYAVTVTTGEGCSAIDSVQVLVNSLPEAIAGDDQTICVSDTAILQASGGTGYTWNNGSSTATILVNPVNSTKYIVTVTNGNGCKDIDTVNVFVNTLPTVSAGVDTSICYGKTIELSATGALDYVWSTGETTASIVVSGTSANQYVVNGTDTNGCSASDTVNISVHTLPTLNAGIDKEICLGYAVQLTVSTTASIRWSTGDSLSSIMVNPTATTTYWVHVTDSNYCSASDSVTVTVNSLPEINIGRDTALCKGQSLNLSINNAYTALWNTGETTSTITVQPSVNTVYSVLAKNSKGCEAKDTLSVQVKNLPYPDAGLDKVICRGQSLQLTATGGVLYAWNNGLMTQKITVSPIDTMVYKVLVTGSNGCSATDSVTVNVKELPLIPIEDTSHCKETYVTFDGGDHMEWIWNNGTINRMITVMEPGTYAVTVVGYNGCRASKSITLSTYDQPLIEVTNDTIYRNAYYNNAPVTIQVSPNTYDFLWHTGETNPSIQVDMPGAYAVLATDANGCTAFDTAVVTEINFNFGNITCGDEDVSEYDAALLYLIVNGYELTDCIVDYWRLSADVSPEYGVIDENDLLSIFYYASDPIEYPLPVYNKTKSMTVNSGKAFVKADGEWITFGELDSLGYISWKNYEAIGGTLEFHESENLVSTDETFLYADYRTPHFNVSLYRKPTPRVNHDFFRMRYSGSATAVKVMFTYKSAQMDTVILDLTAATKAIESKMENTLIVYPTLLNATSSEITIESTVSMERIEVYASDARKMITVENVNALASTLSTRGYASGIYTLVVYTSDGQTRSSRFEVR